mgnify:CR=1 FL=1
MARAISSNVNAKAGWSNGHDHGHGHRHAVAVSNLQELSKLIADNAKSGDIVICLGAGNISSWARKLPKLLCNEY